MARSLARPIGSLELPPSRSRERSSTGDTVRRDTAGACITDSPGRVTGLGSPPYPRSVKADSFLRFAEDFSSLVRIFPKNLTSRWKALRNDFHARTIDS